MTTRMIGQVVGAAVVLGAIACVGLAQRQTPKRVVATAVARSVDVDEQALRMELLDSFEKLMRVKLRTMPTRNAVSKIMHGDPLAAEWDVVRDPGDALITEITAADGSLGWELRGHLRPRQESGYPYPVRAEIVLNKSGDRLRLVTLHFDGERVFPSETR